MTPKKQPATHSTTVIVAAFFMAMCALSVSLHSQASLMVSQLSEDGEPPPEYEEGVPPPPPEWENQDEPPAEDPFDVSFPDPEETMPAPEPVMPVPTSVAVPAGEGQITNEDVFRTLLLQKRKIDELEDTISDMQKTLNAVNATVQDLHKNQPKPVTVSSDAAATHQAPVPMPEVETHGIFDWLWNFFGGHSADNIRMPEMEAE